MQLRPYQIQACDGIREGWKQFSKQLAVLPTGAGKTIVAANVAKEFRDSGKRVMFLAHREELLTQTVDKFIRAAGIQSQLEKAEFRASLIAESVVASVQTLTARGDRWPEDHFGLVIVDEAHHVLAKSYLNVLSRFDRHAKVLGITASPDRADRKNLGSYFENIASEVSLFDLINQGYLSKIVIKNIPLKIDLTKVRTTAGDYNESDLSEALDPWLLEIAKAIATEAQYRKCLVFVPLVATSKKFVEICRSVGLRAEHVDGNSPNRKEILTNYGNGDYDLLSNSMLLTEGFDEPTIDCVVNLRPTKSRALYSQIVGRGTRISNGKQNLLLLDFLYIGDRLSLIRPAHLIAGSEDQAEAITKLSQDPKYGQQELDLQNLATEAQSQREENLKKKLAENSRKKGKTVDAMEWCLKMGAHDLIDYEPSMGWEFKAVSDKQRHILKRAGIDPSTVKGNGHAQRLINQYFNYQNSKPASDAQKLKMKQLGRENWQTATAEDARKFFANLRFGKAA